MRYRADIDGLRSLAILPVVFFHTGFGVFSGGYVGVDIFFVISGYLITSLLLSALRQNEFSLAKFYERRARRILPALLLVCLFCLLVGWFLFIPHDFLMLGRTLAWVMPFTSNFFLRNVGGYFDAPLEENVFLHTWSLAVEEQFYIIFPFILFLAYKYCGSSLTKVLFLIALGSLSLSIWGVFYAPLSSFYFLHTRAWELMLGALVALGGHRHRLPKLSPTTREILAFIACLFILLAIFFYNQHTPFPGWAALLPCSGTALLIWLNHGQQTWIGRILSLQPLVQLGVISYSLYLWHWPLLIFAKYYLEQTRLTFTQASIVIGVSIILAYCSWRWLEQPVRKRSLFKTRARIFIFSVIGLVVLGCAGLLVVSNNGIPSRFSEKTLSYLQTRHLNEPPEFIVQNIDQAIIDKVRSAKLPLLGAGRNPEFLIWGDSHAAVLFPAWKALAEEYNKTGWFISAPSYPVLLETYSNDKNLTIGDKDRYLAFTKALLELVAKHKIKDVVLISMWSGFASGKLKDGSLEIPIRSQNVVPDSMAASEEFFASQLRETVQAFRLAGARVWLMQSVPVMPFDVPRKLARLSLRYDDPEDRCYQPFDQYLADEHAALKAVAPLLASKQLNLLNPAAILCADGVHCRVAAGGEVLYRDNNHLTRAGAFYIKPVLAPVFQAE